MEKRGEFNKIITFLKILTAVIYVAVTLCIFIELIDIIRQIPLVQTVDEISDLSVRLSVFLLLHVMFLGYGGCFFSVSLSIAGLIASVKKKAGKSSVIYFIVFIVLPILTEVTFLIITNHYMEIL